jgi:hypothetical protein
MVLISSLNASGNYLEPNAREQLPLGAKSTEDPDSAIHEHCSSKKPFVLGEKNPAVWYSNSAHWPVITPNAPLRSIKEPAEMPKEAYDSKVSSFLIYSSFSI